MTRRASPRTRRIPRVLGVLIVVLSLGAFAFISHSILARYAQAMQLQAEIDEVQSQIDAQLQKQAALEEQIELLQEPEYIELLAREELGLIRPDDIPYAWSRRR